MVAILSYIQYLIKEHFVYAMAIYTLIFIAVTALFLKYKVNRRRNTPTRIIPTSSRVTSRPRVSFHCNSLIFSNPNAFTLNAKEVLQAIARTSDIYLVTQVRSDEEEEEIRRTLYKDLEMKEVVKAHVKFKYSNRE